MEDRPGSLHTFVRPVRWTARLWSILSVAMVAAFIVGEGFNPTKITPNEWLGFLFFPLGITVGMIVAWWRELVGGIITTGSLFAFYVIHLIISGRFPKGWAWLVFAAPGFLFVLCASWEREKNKAAM